MNIINSLKKYNIKNGELKRLSAKLKVIDLKLENWDKLKASTISDTPIHHDTEHGDKVGEIVSKREELEEDRKRIELDIAELNSFLIEIDSRLDCLQDNYKFVIEKQYKDNVKFSRIVRMYNEKFGIAEYKTVCSIKTNAINELLKL